MQAYDLKRGSNREPEATESHLANSHAARKLLIEQRNALIKALTHSHEAEQSEAHINMVIRVQEAIEVVDKAICEAQRATQRS